jgi:type I restriction enzyme, S subunit
MNTYPTYKDSGIEWMGDIPDYWKLTKNRFGFKKHKNGYNETDETDVLSLTTTGVKVKKNLSFGKSSESYIGHQLVNQGDMVFTPRDFDQTPILSDVSKYNGCISNLYIVDKTKDNVLNHFINYYWYGLKYSVDYFKNFSHGMRYSFNRFQFDEIPLLIPPIQEQQQISDYLDYKTLKIDTLIEKTGKKIELLKEQRTSLINTTVTKGLNPNVEMKDSGVEWIGEISSEWEVKKLTYVTTLIGSGTTPNTSNNLFYKEGHIPWLITGDLNDGYIYKTKKKVTKLAIEKHTSLKIFPINSVSIAMYGATIGKLGLLKIPVTVNQANCVFVFDDVNVPKFWFYVLMGYKPQIISLGYGGGQPNISQDLLKSLRFGCPSHKDQQQIVDYLDLETSKIDKLVDIESKRIDLLKEYRQSLISDVVTGKVDVRDEVLV